MSTHKIKKIPNHKTNKTHKTHTKIKKGTQKIVVFDLDETLGHFSEIGILIEALSILKANHFFKESIMSNSKTNSKTNNKPNSKSKSNVKKDYFHTISKLFFNELMDTFPEFMRPNIIKIFKKLKTLKRNKDVKVVLYTNNMGPRNWTLYIKNYIEHKINSKIFDKIITKYDRHHKHNCRTTHHKTYSDLIKCLTSGGIISNKHDKKIKILFFDDQNHPEMKDKNVKYVKLVPYQVKIPFQKMIQRFNLANSGEKDIFKGYFSLKPEITQEAFYKSLLEILNTINNKHLKFRKKNDKATRKDLLESKKILKAIQKFTKSKSRKKKQKKTTKTRKLK